jgi:hypothetical protein
MELNRTGELAKYRIVHFATHGALAGDVIGSDEPGLVLTPPATNTADDTGYLSASDITQLKLDADWVILSACNTAAGEQRDGEALSGLARAFFYAQARALLVSYWSVYDSAAVRLVEQTTRAFAVDKVDRAQALRQAMLLLIDKGNDYEVQPAYWAPFVLVGEGAGGDRPSLSNRSLFVRCCSAGEGPLQWPHRTTTNDLFAGSSLPLIPRFSQLGDEASPNALGLAQISPSLRQAALSQGNQLAALTDPAATLSSPSFAAVCGLLSTLVQWLGGGDKYYSYYRCYADASKQQL